MTTLKLEELPPLVLHEICEFLSSYPDRLWILNFALASQHCFAIAKRLLYRQITFNPTMGPSDLDNLVKNCEKTLKRDNAFQDVRVLVLATPILARGDYPKWMMQYKDWRLMSPHNWVTLNFFNRGIPRSNDFLHHYLDIDFQDKEEPMPPQDFEEACQPLLHLIRRLPGLSAMWYLCAEQLPFSLLRELEKKDKLCYIHHHALRLSDLPKLSLEVLALITSPNLRTIAVRYMESRGLLHPGAPSYTAEAVQSLVKEEWLAPRLREVRMFHEPAVHVTDINGVPTQQSLPNPSYPIWDGFELDEQDKRLVCTMSHKKEPLRLLELDSHDHRYKGFPNMRSNLTYNDDQAACWHTWETTVDFSKLETLKLGYAVSEANVDSLIHHDFPNLTSLRFTCKEGSSILYYHHVTKFICGLKRLAELDVREWNHKTQSIVGALSPKLELLILMTNPFLGKAPDGDEISRIVDQCPELVDFMLAFHRTRGNAAEVAIYKSIGRLRKLRHLCLRLLACPPRSVINGRDSPDTAIEPHFDAFGLEFPPDPRWRPWRNGHILDTLVNMRLDFRLARVIMEVVSENRGDGFATIQSMTLMSWCPRQIPFGQNSWDSEMEQLMAELIEAVYIFHASAALDGEIQFEHSFYPLGINIWREEDMASIADVYIGQLINRQWPQTITGENAWWMYVTSTPLAGYEERWPAEEARRLDRDDETSSDDEALSDDEA